MDSDGGSESGEEFYAREGTEELHHLSDSSSGYEGSKKSRGPSGAYYQQQIPAVSRLPPELLLEIFDYIDRRRDQYSFILTCQSWFQAAIEGIWFRPALNNESTLKLFLRTVSSPADELSMPYPSFVRRLNLTSCASFLTSEMLGMASSCIRLERLTLSNCSLLTDAGVVAMVTPNRDLQSIDISHLVHVTDETLIAIANNCHKLQGLYASACTALTDNGVQTLITKCPWLKRIKVNGCNLLTDSSLRDLTLVSISLVELDVSSCPLITSTHVGNAFIKLPQLREFRLANNSGITDQPFMSIGDNYRFDKLRVIDLTLCHLITDEAVRKLVRVAPRLRNVVLAKCSNITDRGVQYLVQLGRNLQYLHLGHCSNITDRGINLLVKSCVRLQYIDVACCAQLTDVAVKDLALLPKLRRIGLVKCQNITDSAIYALAHRRGSENTLERVHLSYCGNLTLPAIMVLVNACEKLTHLSLTGVTPFIRSDLTQFCRAPPPEFNQHQQAMFCVFSGKGVSELRAYFNSSLHPASFFSNPTPAPPVHQGLALDTLALAARPPVGVQQQHGPAIATIVGADVPPGGPIHVRVVGLDQQPETDDVDEDFEED